MKGNIVGNGGGPASIVTSSDGSNVEQAILKDAGLYSGITNMGVVVTPVDANATPPAGQSQTFNATIKRAVIRFYEFGAVVTTGIELRVVFGALDDADALSKLTTAGEYDAIPLNDYGEYDYPDSGGSLRMDFATDVATGTNTKVFWKVTL